jgi:hypothetical protein
MDVVPIVTSPRAPIDDAPVRNDGVLLYQMLTPGSPPTGCPYTKIWSAVGLVTTTSLRPLRLPVVAVST